ncbi:MAG: hypothetical protein V1806_18120 [Pseudomonadota bacterium]
MPDDNQIIEAYRSGLSVLDVHHLTGASEKYIRKVIKAAGLTRPASGHNQYTRARAGAVLKLLAGVAR